jgi:MFS family permease
VTTNTQFVHKWIGSKTLGLLLLLSLSVFINYVDRGNLSVAAPLLKEELNLSASQLGVLLGAFFWTYMALMIVSGWLVDRFDVGWVLAVGFVVWSLATGLTGLVHGFATLLICRMLLGAGESVAFPAYGKILARHVPQEHRGLANAIITCGMTLGPAVGTLGFGRLMATYGWRPVFVFLGFVSLIWWDRGFDGCRKHQWVWNDLFVRSRLARFFAGGPFGAQPWATFAVTIRFTS